MLFKKKSITVRVLSHGSMGGGGLMKKRILGRFPTKAGFWLCLCLLQTLPREKEFSGKAERTVRPTTKTTGREPGVPHRRCKNQEGKTKTSTSSKLSSVDMREPTWKSLHLGTKPSCCDAERLQKGWRALKYGLYSKKRRLWVMLEPGRKSFGALLCSWLSMFKPLCCF